MAVHVKITFSPLDHLMEKLSANISPHVKESKTVLDSGLHVVDSGFEVPDSGVFVNGI